MFSKSKINEPAQKPAETKPVSTDTRNDSARTETGGEQRGTAPKAKPPASVLSADLHVVGNLRTTGDIQVEGTIEGDIRAHLLTVGEGATVKGEVIADDVVVNGRIVGRVRGLKVRLTSTARVEGDIIHKTIAIESGAHFEGSVQRQDDPLSGNKPGAKGGAQPAQTQTQQGGAQQGNPQKGGAQQGAAQPAARPADAKQS
ncbi:bactofilin family protein [Roseovarius ramblicola]|uniref:Polymer-forming cytoskeletal protein n=1 Tax=Roseovarius ramblicola TaxID=2022336 RepID=A0ABV5I1S2_9RHOB